MACNLALLPLSTPAHRMPAHGLEHQSSMSEKQSPRRSTGDEVVVVDDHIVEQVQQQGMNSA